MIGPSLPTNLTSARRRKSDDEAQDVIGPQVPSQSASKAFYGPFLPDESIF